MTYIFDILLGAFNEIVEKCEKGEKPNLEIVILIKMMLNTIHDLDHATFHFSKFNRKDKIREIYGRLWELAHQIDNIAREDKRKGRGP